MLTMNVSLPSGMASFCSSRTALAVMTPAVKLTTALELKKSLSTDVLVTCTTTQREWLKQTHSI